MAKANETESGNIMRLKWLWCCGALAMTLAMISALIPYNSLFMLDVITPNKALASKKTFPFGTDPRQAYDFYEPTRLRENSPILLYVYGGGWETGKRKRYRFIADSFASEGFRVAITDYRLRPQAKFPDFIEDIAAAIADIATRFPEQSLIVMGHSAGAYNAMMASINPIYLQAHDIAAPCQVIAGVIGVAGPYGISPMTDPQYFEAFPKRLTEEESVMTFAEHVINAPPTLLISGTDDKIVWSQNAVQLSEQLTLAGAASRVLLYDGQDHIDPIKFLSRWFDGGHSNRTDIIAFLDEIGTKAGCLTASEKRQ